MRRPIRRKQPNQHSDNDMAQGHDKGSAEEQPATTNNIHCPDGRAHANQLSYVEDTGHEELHVDVQAHGFEQGWGVVDQSVDTDELFTTTSSD